MLNLITAAGGNLGSVRGLLERTGTSFKEVSTPDQLERGRPILIPGVGSFGAVMQRLTEAGLKQILQEEAEQNTRILGICSGMQVLFRRSEESEGTRGLGIIPGTVKKFQGGTVPNIGWCRLKEGNSHVYFVNSYHAETKYANDTAQHETGPFTAIAEKGSVTGFQFHPEKSHKAGEQLFRRWRDGL